MTPLEAILRDPPNTYPEWMDAICKHLTGFPSYSSWLEASAASSSSSSSSAKSSIERWRAHVEAHKFTGPTIKLLAVEPNLFAVLDHEYNLVTVVPSAELPFVCNSTFTHPPQRERPKPQLYFSDFETTFIPDLNPGDLDL